MCQKNNILLYFILIVFVADVSSLPPVKLLKGKSEMNSTNDVEYSVLYANIQRNSYANSTIAGATGERLWKKTYKPDFDEIVSPPVMILAKGNTIGIQANPYFIVFNRGIYLKSHYIKASSNGIAFFLPDKYTVIEDNGSMEYYHNYQDKNHYENGLNCFLKDWWNPLMIAPYRKGFIFADQFTGGPSRRPCEFKISFYVPDHTGSFYGDKGTVSNVLLTSTADRIVFTFKKQVYHLDPATGTVIKVFDPGFLSIFKASLDRSNNLVIHAVNKAEKEVLAAFDSGGTKLWEHEAAGSIVNDQPPVCGENGAVFYIAERTLFCVIDGKAAWSSGVFPCVQPLMTVCKDNMLIVQSGLHLSIFDNKGTELVKKLITTDTTEEFTAPPVPAGGGRIYVASGKALYCFR